MLPTLSDDQEFFRETTDRFLTEQVPRFVVRGLRDDPAGFERAYWRGGADLGWTSLLVDEELGGGTISGSGLVDLSLVAYEFGHHAAPGPLLGTNVVSSALSAHRAPGAQAEVLSGLLSGEVVAAWCAPRVGPGGWQATVEARRDGDDVVVRGAARPVEAAGQADQLLVVCGDADGPGTTQVLVPVASAGVSVVPMHSVDLSRRFGVVTFDDVVVSADAVVGEPGAAADDVDRQLRALLVMLNAESVGAMQTGFDMTVEWSFDRYTFGRPLASYQALKHRFADMLSWLEASHAISVNACQAAQVGSPDADERLSAAKAFIGEYGAELLQDCVQIHGGIGVTFEHDLHLFLRRLLVDRAFAGTPADHRQRITSLLEAAGGAAA
jgi:alkylation response protein AidB-like acyl-CoA dehydrogenase